MTPEQFSQWTSFLSDGMLLLTRSGDVLASNPAAGELGIPRARLVGKPLANFASRRSGSLDDFFRECARVSSPIGTTIVFKTEKDQTQEYYCEGLLNRWSEHGGQQTLLLKIKAREQSTVRQFTVLNEKIEELNTENTRRAQSEKEQRRLAEELAVSNRRKDRFLTNLAKELHDLLTPMGDDLEKTDSDPKKREQRKKKLIQHIRYLKALADDLLVVSRINRKELDISRGPIDISRVIARAQETITGRARKKGVILDVSLAGETLIVEGDEDSLVQVVTNLLDNAVNCTPRDGRVSLKVTVTDKNEVSIILKDTGAGIPKAQLDHLFEVFSKVDRSNPSEDRGLGVGLTLVQQLVSLHHGEVHAKSEGPGEGSTFQVILPRAEANAKLPSRQQPGA